MKAIERGRQEPELWSVDAVYSFCLSGCAVAALTVSVYVEAFHSARLAVVMLLLFLVHFMGQRRVLISREVVAYAAFLTYMLVELLWTKNIALSSNTIVPAIAYLFVITLFASLVFYHSPRAVFSGALAAFVVSVVFYFLRTGFPLRYPADFSYNAIASMYLFGIVLAMCFGCFFRARSLTLTVVFVLWLHVVATTSIKTNIGVFFGIAIASLVHFGQLRRFLRRYAVLLLGTVAAFGYIVMSTPALMDGLGRGISRVSLGLQILQVRGDVSGYGGVQSRQVWQADGIDGWLQSPVIGHGVEAFRSKFGITSHSTPIDLLYNSGLIGLVLFYALFALLLARLWSSHHVADPTVRFVVLAVVLCNLSVTLSGIFHYNAFHAATFGILIALMRKQMSPAPLETTG